MPQFQLVNFVPQLAWLALFFAILYFGIVRLTLPKIGRVVEGREAMVEGDIATAERSKAEADAIRSAYEADMAQARGGAQASMAEAKASAARATEVRLAEAGKGIDSRLAEAEAALSAARDGAKGEIERIAAEAAADIVALVGTTRPDEAAASAAVRQAA